MTHIFRKFVRHPTTQGPAQGQEVITLRKQDSHHSTWTQSTDTSEVRSEDAIPMTRVSSTGSSIRKKTRMLSSKVVGVASSVLSVRKVFSAPAQAKGRNRLELPSEAREEDVGCDDHACNSTVRVVDVSAGAKATRISPNSTRQTVSFAQWDDEEYIVDACEECRTFVQSVCKRGKLNFLGKEMVADVEDIIRKGASFEENPSNIQRVTMQFVGTVLKEAWGCFQDQCKLREDKAAELEKEADAKVRKSQEMQRKSIEMQAQSLKEVTMLRDQKRSLGSHLVKEFKVTNFEALDYVDEETRSLVLQILEERMKLIMDDAEREDSQSVLGVLIQERIKRHTVVLLDKISKMEIQIFDLNVGKGFLETEVDVLKRGKESCAEALEKAHRELEQAVCRLKVLEDSKAKVEMELATATKDAERVRLSAMQAHSSVESIRSAIAAEVKPISREELQAMCKGEIIREAATRCFEDKVIERVTEAPKEVGIEIILETQAAVAAQRAAALGGDENAPCDEQKKAAVSSSKSSGASSEEQKKAAVSVPKSSCASREEQKKAAPSSRRAGGQSDDKKAPLDGQKVHDARNVVKVISRDKLQSMSKGALIREALALGVDDDVLEKLGEMTEEALIELIMEVQAGGVARLPSSSAEDKKFPGDAQTKASDHDNSRPSSNLEANRQASSAPRKDSLDSVCSEKLQELQAAEEDSSGHARSSRPILPGAAATVQLAHAQELQTMLEASPRKAVDLVAVLGGLGAAVVKEFSEMVATIDLPQALKHFEKRLDITRREADGLRRLCTSLLEDLLALHDILQGRGQPQVKLNVALKRLPLTMQALRTHFSSNCVIAQYSVEHLEELRRFALASGTSEPQELEDEVPRSTAEEEEDPRCVSISCLTTTSWDSQTTIRQELAKERIPGVKTEPNMLPLMKRLHQPKAPISSRSFESLDTSASGGMGSLRKASITSATSVKSPALCKSPPQAATPQASQKTMTLALEEPAVVLKTSRSLTQAGTPKRSSLPNTGGPKRSSKVHVLDDAASIVATVSNGSRR